MSLIFALPSKGRLKDQVEAWLEDCGLAIEMNSGTRSYQGRLKGQPDVEIRLLSAGDIAQALERGEVHLGITGEDLIREIPVPLEDRFALLMPLGFGRADLVVAVPASWLDVSTMADLDDVAHLHRLRTGQRMRVATKYVVQTRGFFAGHGVADYRIVESGGATEGSPAAGLADLVVDITSSGATLAANGLKTLGDGILLRSQAWMVAALRAAWTEAGHALLRRLTLRIEARSRARRSQELLWAENLSTQELTDLSKWGRLTGPASILVAEVALDEVVQSLACMGVSAVVVRQPDYVFAAESDALRSLQRATECVFDKVIKK